MMCDDVWWILVCMSMCDIGLLCEAIRWSDVVWAVLCRDNVQWYIFRCAQMWLMISTRDQCANVLWVLMRDNMWNVCSGVTICVLICGIVWWMCQVAWWCVMMWCCVTMCNGVWWCALTCDYVWRVAMIADDVPAMRYVVWYSAMLGVDAWWCALLCYDVGWHVIGVILCDEVCQCAMLWERVCRCVTMCRCVMR